jgi:hypothetical protein
MTLFAFVFTIGSFALPFMAHAGIPYFGPIIPGGNSSVCPAGWGMLIIVINNLISFLITIAIVFVAPLMIAYAGFLFVVNPVSSGGIQKAKDILTNTIVGIVIALAGYLIVDAVMAVLYNPNEVGKTWSEIINWNGDTCLPQAGALPGDVLTQAVTPGVTTGTAGGLRSTDLSTVAGNPCNPSTITAAAQSAGYPISTANANLLACVAQGESTCGTSNPPFNLNYSWNKDSGNGKASTAAGAYQVLLSSNSDCYNNPVCEAAVNVDVPLNCKRGFDSKGYPIPGSTIVETCKLAAGNVNCSAAAAACLLRKQSFAAAYATDPYTASCQARYGS